MKKLLLFLTILHLFIACNGQESNIYSARVEYGLKGKVKEMTSYICKVEDNQIPKDTTDFIGKYTVTFDELGNARNLNKLYNIDGFGHREYKIVFSGTGKDISFKDSSFLEDGKVVENNYKYVWSDNYNYTILSEDNDTFSTNISLDKNYRLIKSISKFNEVQTTEELETIYKNKRIQKIINKMTENRDDEVIERIQIQVVQECDINGNPTIIYVFNDKREQKIEQVIYKEYKY